MILRFWGVILALRPLVALKRAFLLGSYLFSLGAGSWRDPAVGIEDLFQEGSHFFWGSVVEGEVSTSLHFTRDLVLELDSGVVVDMFSWLFGEVGKESKDYLEDLIQGDVVDFEVFVATFYVGALLFHGDLDTDLGVRSRINILAFFFPPLDSFGDLGAGKFCHFLQVLVRPLGGHVGVDVEVSSLVVLVFPAASVSIRAKARWLGGVGVGERRGQLDVLLPLLGIDLVGEIGRGIGLHDRPVKVSQVKEIGLKILELFLNVFVEIIPHVLSP